MKRRTMMKAATALISPNIPAETTFAQGPQKGPQSKMKRAYAADPRGSRVNMPVQQRDGKTAQVFFTRNLSSEGLRRIYAKVGDSVIGRTAVKLHTGERNGPNILPREWVRTLLKDIADAHIVEANTLYEGDRYTSAQHRETLRIN